MPKASLPCHICGTERKFLEYGSKMGKDGRMAKWPIYEPCPEKNNPDKHPNSQDAATVSFLKDMTPERKPVDEENVIQGREPRMGIKGRMHQLPHMNVIDLGAVLQRNKVKYGWKPTKVGIHPDDLPKMQDAAVSLKIDLVSETTITPGYRYVFIYDREETE